MKTTIYRDPKSVNTFDAVCWYAKQKVTECNDSTIEIFGETNINLSINGSIQIENITISLIRIGNPVAVNSYLGEPRIYKELVIEGPDEDEIIKFIHNATLEYNKKCKEFIKSDTHILILTWDSGRWHDEYKTPKRSNKSIYLPDDTYQKVLDDLNTFYSNSERYQQLEIPYARTYMLHGLPGTGKTSMIYTVATELEKNIAILDFSDRDMSDSSIRNALYKLPSDTILCLEDMDALFSDRKSDKSTITFSGVLNILDGVIKNTGLVIFMTTNLLGNMDDTAMKRRVDYYLKFDLMKRGQIEKMFLHFFPTQDVNEFVLRISKLQLTPCILQKFFVKYLMTDNIIQFIDKLQDMCEHDYKIINNNSMYT